MIDIRQTDDGQPMDEARYHVPLDLPVDDAIREITGQAICHVDGVLGLKGTLSDVFKRDDDLRRGITVRGSENTAPSIEARIIVDAAQDPKQVVQEVTQSIEHALNEGAGLQAIDLQIDVATVMSRNAFYKQYGADRSCEVARN